MMEIISLKWDIGGFQRKQVIDLLKTTIELQGAFMLEIWTENGFMILMKIKNHASIILHLFIK